MPEQMPLDYSAWNYMYTPQGTQWGIQEAGTSTHSVYGGVRQAHIALHTYLRYICEAESDNLRLPIWVFLQPSALITAMKDPFNSGAMVEEGHLRAYRIGTPFMTHVDD